MVLRIGEMLKVFALVISFVVFAANICLAQSPSDASTAEKVTSVSDWVLHKASTPKPAEIDGDAARLLGLGKSTLRGIAVGRTNKDADLAVYFVTLPGRSDVLLVRKDPKLDRTIYWRVKGGALSTTVQRQNGKLTVVSGEVYDKAGMNIVNFFYDRAGEPHVDCPKSGCE